MEWLLLLLAGGGTVKVAQRITARRRSRRELEQELDAVRRLVDEDVIVFGEQLGRLDARVGRAQLDAEVHADYQRALDAYESAQRAARRIEHAIDGSHVSDILTDGRHALACVQARTEGLPLPALRAPCFFNPQHGPSMQDVEWTPPGGTPRVIAICAADARRLAAGEEPLVRMVRIGDRWVPWHLAGSVQGAIDAGAHLARSGGHGVHGQQNLSQAYLNQAMGGYDGTGGGFS